MCKARYCCPLLVGLLLHLSFRGTTQAVESDTAVVTAVEDTPNYFNAVSETDTAVVTIRQASVSKRDSLKKEEAFWYADYEPEQKKPVDRSPSAIEKLFAARWFKTLLWTIVISGFAAILIWFLKASDIRLYRKKERVVLAAEEHTENIFEIDFASGLEDAISSGDYRQGVRLLYLQLLKELSDSGKISYRQERTNSDYRRQLFDTPLYSPFSRLTHHYEYVWYGKFPLSEEDFHRIHQEYLSFNKTTLA